LVNPKCDPRTHGPKISLFREESSLNAIVKRVLLAE
jgi:hypothetical protein